MNMSSVPTVPAPSVTDVVPEAPAHPLPSDRYYCIEFPGFVKDSSVPRAIQHLGGQASIDSAFRRNANKIDSLLELSWRPETPFAHPIPGGAIHANNILLKIRKRKRRKLDGDAGSEHEGEFTAEAVGVIPKTIRFRHMADFQYTPDETDDVVQLRKALDRMDVEYIRKYTIPPEKEDYVVPLDIEQPEGLIGSATRSNLRLPPPPLFSRQSIPQIYNYKANNQSVLTTYVDSETGEEKKRLINRARWKGLNAASISFSSPTVPTKPPSSVEEHAGEVNEGILARLKEIFEERPVWTRTALNNQFSAADARELNTQRYIIPLVCYVFNDGPWRDTFVKLGYDPRTDPEARFYQRLYFRNVLHPIARPSVIGRKEEQRSTSQAPPTFPASRSLNQQSGEAPPSHIFDGIHLTKETAAYQLCDIVDPMVKAMIEDESGVRNECDERDGWYTTHILEHIKIVLRHKFFSLLEGRIASDEECKVLLEGGWTVKYRDNHRIDIRKHNMAKGAVPPEDAAAIRLRAALDNSASKNISGRGR